MVIAAVILYFAVILGASLALSRKGSSSDFFRGSGRSPWPVVAIAMVGTSISGVTFVSVPGMVAASEFSYLQMALGFIAGYAVIAYVLLPLYYSRRMNSLYCYVEERFGAWSYHTSAAFFLLSKVLGCGVKMYLTATVLQLVLFSPLGIPFWLNIALTMLIVYLYTFRFLRTRTGGYHAKTPHGCLLISLATMFAALGLAKTFHSPLFVGAVLFAAALCIFALAPANNASLHLTANEIAAIQPRVRLRLAGTVLMGGLLLYICAPLASCMAVSLLAVAVMLVLANSGLGAQ